MCYKLKIIINNSVFRFVIENKLKQVFLFFLWQKKKELITVIYYI